LSIISVEFAGWMSFPEQQCRSTDTARKRQQLEYGPVPNVMAALPNIGGALCSTPQSLADAHY